MTRRRQWWCGFEVGFGDVDDVAAQGPVVEPDRVRGAQVHTPVRDIDHALIGDRPRGRVHERAAVGDAYVVVDLFVVAVRRASRNANGRGIHRHDLRLLEGDV